MSYQVLARKYRPKNFDSLVGQEHVVRALTHALEQKRLHHAYLFTGTRGVGKTTLSRILAKSLNCQGTDGSGDITAQPCGQCEACVAIDAGRFVDLWPGEVEELNSPIPGERGVLGHHADDGALWCLTLKPT